MGRDCRFDFAETFSRRERQVPLRPRIENGRAFLLGTKVVFACILLRNRLYFKKRRHLGDFLIMAYSNFTLAAALETFRLEIVRAKGLFAASEPVEPSALLAAILERNVSHALSIGTEKAKSELIVAQVLVELCEHFDNRVSLFSGIDFNVDTDAKLVGQHLGVCDFLVSLSADAYVLEAPVIILVEAKRDSLTDGLGQCVAEMVAAQRFNTEKGNDIPCVYGATTSGLDWLFLKVEGQTLSIDAMPYQIAQCERILGILASMVSQQA